MSGVKEGHKLSLAKVSVLSHLGQFDDTSVHEVELRDSHQFSDQVSVPKIVHRSWVKHIFEKPELALSQLNSQPGKNAHEVAGFELAGLREVKCLEYLLGGESVVCWPCEPGFQGLNDIVNACQFSSFSFVIHELDRLADILKGLRSRVEGNDVSLSLGLKNVDIVF